MMLFVSNLVKILTQRSANWRLNHYFLLDNASYHKSKATRAMYDSLNVKIMFSAPYSYSAAPVELLFANFKKTAINPQIIKTGKR